MKIASIIRIDLKPGSSERHSHNIWEFILTVNGNCTIVAGQERYPCRKGTVIAIPPGFMHHNESDDSYTHIGIRMQDFVSPSGNAIHVFQDDSAETFATLAEIVFRQFYLNHSAAVVDAICEALYALFFRTVSTETSNPEIEKAKNMFAANFTDPEFSCSTALALSNYSEAHFRKLFREETGITPVTYLTKLRIDYAKKLLSAKSTPPIPLSQIALYAGFYDQRYFARLFKKYTGWTPAEYRKRMEVAPVTFVKR